jgi:hypothetical protein
MKVDYVRVALGCMAEAASFLCLSQAGTVGGIHKINTISLDIISNFSITLRGADKTYAADTS